MKNHNTSYRLLWCLPFIFCISCWDSDCKFWNNNPSCSEIKELLYHYSVVDPVPQKYQAAKFIIDNIKGHYSYAGNQIYDYYDFAASLLSDSLLSPEQQRDSLLFITDSRFKDLPKDRISDKYLISADYLIYNIDKSFEQWSTCPWASQLSFQDYLEWLLPYKAVEYQELDCWRDTLLAHFGSGLDNPVVNDVEYNTTLGVADMIRSQAYSSMHRYGLYTRSGLPLLSSYLLPRQTFGNIPDYALVGVLALRAAGVPAVLDDPDLVPVMAVVAAGAHGVTHFTNASRLKIKESDRLVSVTQAITALGGQASQDGESLTVWGDGTLAGGTVCSENDHRIVMLGALAAFICSGAVCIEDAGAIAKSFPTFFDELKEGGALYGIDIREQD